MANEKSSWLQGIKAGVSALIFSCIGVLLLALFAKLFSISDSILPIINQVLKVVAVALGVAISVKDQKFLLKALVGAVVYWLLSALVFSLLGGAFHWAQIALDLAVAVAAAVIVALVKSRKA